ncbi:piggyBac transposable element-derived protein 3-like isoform X2 [Mugil cephalus]|uniref:piggyBac transposable element-derived protein 3-like isoform X2 n=1 Tax=Mugil cephalus TaxID=48193 RepID=UPI001FB5815B|nr:piggyBac transposable element-derived protein 3-like isoform X2 [Mugil cephalus]
MALRSSGTCCAVRGCTNNQTKLNLWLKEQCFEHAPQTKRECCCENRFSFHRLPKDEEHRRMWLKNLNLKKPPQTLYVCSFHFVDKKPTEENPHPTLWLGYVKSLEMFDSSVTRTSADVSQHHGHNEEEVLAEQQLFNQDRNSNFDQKEPEHLQIKEEEQEEPEALQIKEEEDEFFTSQEEEQLILKQEIDTVMVTYEENDLLPSDDSPVAEHQDHKENRIPLSNVALESNAGVTSEVEELSDVDDAAEYADYRPRREEPSTTEEESSGNEDPVPQPTEASRGRKRLRCETDGYLSDCSTSNSRTPGHWTQQIESDDSNDDDEEPTPGPSFQGQPKHGHGLCWRAAELIPNLAQFEPGGKTEQDREGWTPLDYVNQYIDRDLMEHIVYCSNVMAFARSGYPLNTSVDEMYHFFGASILMSCVPYPRLRMYWCSVLRFPAITERFTRGRFFKLRQSIKVVVDDEIPEVLRECDKFWKVRPFLDRILEGCKSQARPECVAIAEQMIPFTGACPCRQYLPLNPNPVGMKNFVCASPEGIVLDFELYQGADALTAQVQEPGRLGLGGLVVDRLSETLCPGTKVYCNRFFTSIEAVNRMMEKQVYLTGTVRKNRVLEAARKLPSDKTMKKEGRGSSAQVTTEDGKICVVKWYDDKPVLMLSVAHDAQPEDTCQRWDKRQRQYVTIRRPSVVREYENNMGGIDIVDRTISYYRMTDRTKKWTLRMLMHFTDIALANSWLLYRQDHTMRSTPKKCIMQFLEFRMEVAKTFLAQHNHVQEDIIHFSEQGYNTEHLEPEKKRFVKELPHISVRRRANAHLPEVVNLKNAARCRAAGCSGKTRVRCATCKVFLCLQAARNCYTVFHSG